MRRGIAVGDVGVALRPRAIGVVVALTLGCAAALVASVMIGTVPVAFGDVLRAVLGGGFPAGGVDAELIVRGLRLPRALVALGAGLAFGLAGAVFQTATRNPLASPDLIGVCAGAGAGAVATILVGGVGSAGASTLGAVPFGALAGALLTAAVMYLFAHRDGTVTGYRFVLVGLAMTGALTSLTRWMLARADIDQASRAMVWLVGSLNGRTSEHLTWIALGLAVLLPPVVVLIRPYRLLGHDDDTARGLGLPLGRPRVALLAAATGLTAVATAVAGPVGFVALCAPQIARRLTAASDVPLVASGLVGALLLAIADVVGRTVLAPVDIPVGVVTGFLGAPYLLSVLVLTNRAGQGG